MDSRLFYELYTWLADRFMGYIHG